MTTVAWSRASGVMAADEQSSYHCNGATKIFRLPDGSVVGVSGSAQASLEALEYFEIGSTKPSLPDDSMTAFRVYVDGSVVMYHNKLVAIPVTLDFMAIGSGGDYAMGAMAQGATPQEAVAVAHMFDPNTGAEIDVLQTA